MWKKINPEEMEQAFKNVRVDHPKVRRIKGNLYGVTCRNQKRCAHKAEHEIEFDERPDGLYSDCRGCETDRWKEKTCRHRAAALMLFMFNHENPVSTLAA